MREIELKFGASVPFDPAAFLDADGTAGGVVELPSQDLRATYYDTDDLRLARSGATLRYRAGEGNSSGWSIKLPAGTKGQALARAELHFEGSSQRIPAPAAGLAIPYARFASLRPVATLRTKRKRWTLLAADGRELAVLTDDQVSVVEGRRVVSRFRELEVEASGAKKGELESIARALRAGGAVSSEPIPKVVRALGPRATAAGDVPAPRDISSRDPAKVAVAEAAAAAVRLLVANDSPARLGDPEGVHQMRVAARRLRSDLRTFSSLVDEAWAASLVEELRWVGRTLGDVRDLDVLRARIEADSSGIRDDLDPLMQWITERSTLVRTALDEALMSDRYRALLERMVDAAADPVVTELAENPCRDVLPSLVAGSWRKLRKAARGIDEDVSDESLHRVRIRAKRARYAAEALAPYLDDGDRKAATRFGARAERIQDILGLHQDAVVTTNAVLEVVGQRPEDGAFNLAAGRLLERQQWARERERRRWPKAWMKMDQRRVTGWLNGKA
jgi:CHAD domain-containing protein